MIASWEVVADISTLAAIVTRMRPELKGGQELKDGQSLMGGR